MRLPTMTTTSMRITTAAGILTTCWMLGCGARSGLEPGQAMGDDASVDADSSGHGLDGTAEVDVASDPTPDAPKTVCMYEGKTYKP